MQIVFRLRFVVASLNKSQMVVVATFMNLFMCLPKQTAGNMCSTFLPFQIKQRRWLRKGAISR